MLDSLVNARITVPSTSKIDVEIPFMVGNRAECPGKLTIPCGNRGPDS